MFILNSHGEIPWYEEKVGFFGPSYLKEYLNYFSDERTIREIDFILDIIHLKPSSAILDCPCGHGRHCIEMAKRGDYRLTGQDINSFLLDKAKYLAQKNNVSVSWVKADMRDINFSGVFDLVINLFSSFGYLENDFENQKVLHEIAKSLKKGGSFVLDVINRNYILNTLGTSHSKYISNDHFVSIKRSFNHYTKRKVEHRVRNFRGEIFEYFSSIRIYDSAELVTMCQNSGFLVKEIYGDYNGNKFDINSTRCILIAEKR